MPLLETETDRLVVRIVYAGPPSSGKSETVRQLMKLLGGNVSGGGSGQSESADSIVFVTGSNPRELIHALSYYDEITQWLVRSDTGRAVSVIVQANKQDLPGALGTEDIRAAMGLNNREIYGSVAPAAEGIQVPYISATRACIARARELHGSGKLQSGAALAPPVAVR